jgi:ATP-binding cassette subfamily B protein
MQPRPRITSREGIVHALRVLHPARALRLVWAAAPGWTVASVPLLVLQGLLPLVTLYLLKLMVDAVVAGASLADREQAFREVAVYIALAGAAFLVGGLCGLLSQLVTQGQSEAVTDHVHSLLHERSVAVDLAYYEDSRYYDTLHRAQQEAPYRPTRIVNRFAEVLRSGLALAGMGGLIVSFHPLAAAALLVATIPEVLVRLRYSDRLYAWARERTADERRAWYYHWLLTRDEHAKELRLFGFGDLFRRRFRRLRRRLREERLGLLRRRTGAELLAQTVITVVIFGTYGFIAYRAVVGTITLGDLVIYYQAVQRGQGYLRQLLSAVAGLYEDSLFLDNFYELLDLEPRVREPADPRPVPRPMHRGIEVRGLSFRYPNGEREVLRGVDLSLGPGEVIALVGENSAGKTTLIKLLCRLYDPTAGTITWDGVDLREMGLAALRREIGVVFQDFARYQLTARENVWLGNVELPEDAPRIEASARRADVHHAFAALPKGYDTVLGKWFEDGHELSIGQWQKVALARAFLSDAQVIILDEPTSSLDAAAEEAVMHDFRRLIEGRSAILISHRLSTVKMADRIYVLGDGRIVENGSHDELVRRGGVYARIFETQAKSYR